MATDWTTINAQLKQSYEKRLKSKLAGRFPINLKFVQSDDGTESAKARYQEATFQPGQSVYSIRQAFNESGGRLLIVGQPGAGKTTVALQLAIELIEAGSRQLPIIINIASWRKRFKHIHDWLIELLPQMGFSPTLVKEMIKEDRILPFFDGLDELSADLRDGFLDELGEYGQNEKAQYIISSRIEEYRQTIDAPVKHQIKIEPLTSDQIKFALRASQITNKELLLDAIERDELLAEAVRNPFYLNAAQLLFARGKAWSFYQFEATDLSGRQVEITDRFASYALSKMEDDHPPEESKKWLGFLAHRMEHFGLADFELASLQGDWVETTKRERITSKMYFALLYAAVFGPILGIFGGVILLLSWTNPDLQSPNIFLFAIVVTTLSLFIYQNTERAWSGDIDDIQTTEKISVKWIEFMGFLLGVGIAIILMFFLFDFLINLLTTKIFYSFLDPESGGGFYELIRILRALIPYYLGIGILLLLFESPKDIDAGIYRGPGFLIIKEPYHRFMASMKRLNFSILNHFSLRRLMSAKGVLPYRLVPFLNTATHHHLLESTGGTWRFRHRILQDYFRKHWEEKYAEAHPLGEGESVR